MDITTNNKLILLVNPCSYDRKIIHQYLNITNTMSIHLTNFYSEMRFYVTKCYGYNCSKKVYFTPNDYERGSMPNNIDERYATICKHCGALNVYEPNYEDRLHSVSKNNAIVVGKILEGYNKPLHAVNKIIDKQSFNDVMSRTKIFQFNTNKCKNKKDVIRYCEENATDENSIVFSNIDNFETYCNTFDSMTTHIFL